MCVNKLSRGRESYLQNSRKQSLLNDVNGQLESIIIIDQGMNRLRETWSLGFNNSSENKKKGRGRFP